MKNRTLRIVSSGIRTMRKSRARTFFMMLSIIIGIKALTLTINVGQGIEKKIMDGVSKFIGPENVLVLAEEVEEKGIRQSEQGPNTSFKIEDVEAILEQIPEIISYDYMQILPEKEVGYQSVNQFATVKGCRPVGEDIWNKSVEYGEFFDDFDMKESKRVAVLGPDIAEKLFADQDPLERQIKISGIPFKVIGIVEAQGADPHGENLDEHIYIPITTLMRRVANIDYIMTAKFEFESMEEATSAEEEIRSILRDRHAIADGQPDDFNLMTPVQVKAVVSKMVKVFNVLLPAIAIIALLAGAIVIIVLMNIAVNQRVNEIGLRKAIGAKDQDISNQFLAETLAVVVIGGIIGSGLGLLTSKLISNKLNAVFYISPATIIVGVLIPVVIGLIAGIMPAKKAAKLDPVVSIKS